MTNSSDNVQKNQEKKIAWAAPEFYYIENTVNWYWIVGTIGLLSCLISFISGNWTFGVLLVISTIMLMVLSRSKPRIMHVSLNKKHITINDKKYYLKEYDSYRIDEDRDKLLLKSKKAYVPLTIAPLPHEAPKNKIESLLENETDLEQSDELSEPVLEIILHRLGF